MPHLEPLALRSWQLGSTPPKYTDVARLLADLEETEALLLLPSVEAAMGGRTTTSILESIVNSVPVPEGTRA